MKKQYITPAFAVVEIKKSDVIATSVNNVANNVNLFYGGGYNGYARVGERRFDEWYEGF